MATTGQRLRTERERRGISIAQAVDGTHIKTDHVLAMEADDWSAFSAHVYVRGFVKTYARFLRLDEHEMAIQLDRELSGQDLFEDSETVSSGLRRGVLDFMMMKLALLRWQVVFLLVIGVGLIGVVLWVANRRSRLQVAPSSGRPATAVRLYQHNPESVPSAILPLPSMGGVSNVSQGAPNTVRGR